MVLPNELASVNVGMILYSQLVLTEELFTLLILAAFERLAAFVVRKDRKALLLSGFIFGCSIIIKASALYYVFFLAFFLIVLGFRFKSSLLFLLVFSIPVGLYAARNRHMYGHWFIKAVDKVNLYTLYLPKLIAATDGVTIDNASITILQTVQVSGNWTKTAPNA